MVEIIKLKFKKKIIFKTIEYNTNPNINIFYRYLTAIPYNCIKFINRRNNPNRHNPSDDEYNNYKRRYR